MSTGQKKFAIKSFKSQNIMDSGATMKTWTTLENAIHQIYHKNASKLSFEELYRGAYNLVLNKQGELLYKGVSETIKQQLLLIVEGLALEPNERLLACISRSWSEHKISMNMIKDILMYMDRTYVTQHKKIPIYNTAVLVYRLVVIEHPDIKERLKAILLANVESERNGLLIDRDVMKDILEMLVEVGVDGVNFYEEEFEKAFLDCSRMYYRQESQQFIADNSCSDFLKKAEKRTIEEQNRLHAYLASTTGTKLRLVVEMEYINTHARTLVEMEGSGCEYLFQHDKADDLLRMFTLFSRVSNTLDFVRDYMGKFIKCRGDEIISDVNNPKDPVTFVQRMLDLKGKFDAIIHTAFRGDNKFLKKLKESFEEIINKDTRSASYLASYVDDLLKSGLKGRAEADIELLLDRVMVLFRYISDKDIFENMYRGHLSKRLLNNKSISDDIEKQMLSKLKSECGQQFTSKLEGMFLDMNLSKEIMEGYRITSFHTSTPVEMDVQTLTAAHWSLKVTSLCKLPPSVFESCEKFSSYYMDRFKTGRRLTWLPTFGTADIKANYASGRRDLNVSTYQMCILMLFNSSTTLSLNQIRTALGNIQEIDLRRHLLSLCTPKLRILKKASKSKNIEDDDVISFNEDFTSKFKRIKVPLISSNEIALPGGAGAVLDDGDVVPSAVEEERRHLLEASIVRIMKTRKRLSHNDLVAETTRQMSSRFHPSPLLVKQRVESLIERDYMMRDKDDHRLYQYLA